MQIGAEKGSFRKPVLAPTRIAPLQPIIIEEAVRSGLFNSAETPILIYLLKSIHTYNTKGAFIYSVLHTGVPVREFDNFEYSRTGLIEICERSLTWLREEEGLPPIEQWHQI
jgi:hypothetical protein